MLTIVDNSTLKAIASCKTEAVVKYHLNLVPSKAKLEDAPRLAGKAVHAGIAHFLRGGTVEEAMRVVEVMYRPFADAEVPQSERRMLWANVERCALSWFQQYPTLDALPFVPVTELIEVAFAVRITDELYLTGLLDGVVQDTLTSRYYVLETKTTGQKSDWWMRQWRLNSQISHYTFCAQRSEQVKEVIGKQEIAGVYLNKVDMSLLPSDPKLKCNRGQNAHGVPFSECGMLHAQHVIQPFKRSAREIDAWWTTVQQLLLEWTALRSLVRGMEDIEGVTQEGFFNGSCIFCDLNDWCATGRSNLLMLKETKWGPIQRETISSTEK